MKNMVKSDVPQSLEVKFFTATVESVLLYGRESWTLTSRLEKRLDNCYKNASLYKTDSLGEACYKPGSLRWATES